MVGTYSKEPCGFILDRCILFSLHENALIATQSQHLSQDKQQTTEQDIGDTIRKITDTAQFLRFEHPSELQCERVLSPLLLSSRNHSIIGTLRGVTCTLANSPGNGSPDRAVPPHSYWLYEPFKTISDAHLAVLEFQVTPACRHLCSITGAFVSMIHKCTKLFSFWQPNVMPPSELRRGVVATRFNI